MSRMYAQATAIIDAPASEVYATIADYRNGHPNILPSKHFSDLRIEQGGIGDGTVIRVKVRALGVEQEYHMVVQEPEPGRILTETDVEKNVVTSFTVTPAGNGEQSEVRIATEWEGRTGLSGVFERLGTPPVMRRIYSLELNQLAEYMRTRKKTALSPA